MSQVVAGDAAGQIIAAARPLFAERGIDGVSTRELLRASGQRNSNALSYHFGDRAGLVVAILTPFQQRVDDRRDALLDALEAAGTITVRGIAEALVRPSASMLGVDGGKDYLRITAELNDDLGRAATIWPEMIRHMDRWVAVADVAIPDVVAPLHRRYAAIQLTFSELRRRAATVRRPDFRLFESDLTDLVAAILATEPSEETRRLLAERDG